MKQKPEKDEITATKVDIHHGAIVGVVSNSGTS